MLSWTPRASERLFRLAAAVFFVVSLLSFMGRFVLLCLGLPVDGTSRKCRLDYKSGILTGE